MAMTIRYEEQEVGLLDTVRTREFVAAFRDLSRDLNGQRFTVDVGPIDWRMRESELTFQVTPETRIAVLGSSFEPDPKPDFSALLGHDGPAPKSRP